jgi:glycosyltransferase involved in cell wall biosynthesis
MVENRKEKISVVIPVFNEEGSIGKVLEDIPEGFVNLVVVVDNGSTDGSVRVAKNHGALVLTEKERGYGAACLKGIEYLKKKDPPDILIFLDGDYSDFPEDMLKLIEKIDNGYDFVLGSRVMGAQMNLAKLSKHSILGNKLAALFLKLLFKGNFTDLGPFRAIKFDKLLALNMQDRNFGWTMEMQIKAVKMGINICEVPVRYRARYAGKSKVTGTFKGSILAFLKITYTVLLYFFRIKR